MYYNEYVVRVIRFRDSFCFNKTFSLRCVFEILAVHQVPQNEINQLKKQIKKYFHALDLQASDRSLKRIFREASLHFPVTLNSHWGLNESPSKITAKIK